MLKTICSVSLLFLAGCKTMENAPITKLYVVDLAHSVCSERVITDKRTLTSKHVADLSIEQCDGIIGLAPAEFLNLRTYLKGKEK